MRQSRQTLKLLRRSPYQALAAILAMTLTFFITSLFVVILAGGHLVLKFVEQRPTMSVFFKNDTETTKINELENKIRESGYAREVKYITRNEALAIFQDRFKDQKDVLEIVTADILPESIEVYVHKPNDIEEVSKIIQNRDEISNIVYPKDVTKSLAKWTSFSRLGGIILVSTLMAISFLIIVMVIGMRVAIRREEISIMNLVGATRWYIAKPFFIEGILYGVIGASVATLLTYALLLFYSPNIQQFLGEISVFPIHPLFFVYLWLSQIGAAATLGVAGTAIALYRYLKIK